MHDIDMQEMSPEFFECWKAAYEHLNDQVDDGIHSWLRVHPYPPFLEHLSFRLCNQLFFVRIVDADSKIQPPGSMQGLFMIAEATGGHACILPMKRPYSVSPWVAEEPGWGLLDARTHKPVNPVVLVTQELIEMTPWELQDMAVQVVRESIEDDGYELILVCRQDQEARMGRRESAAVSRGSGIKARKLERTRRALYACGFSRALCFSVSCQHRATIRG